MFLGPPRGKIFPNFKPYFADKIYEKKIKMVLTEKEFIHICLEKEVSTGMSEINKETPPRMRGEFTVSRYQEHEDFHQPTLPEISSDENNRRLCTGTRESRSS